MAERDGMSRQTIDGSVYSFSKFGAKESMRVLTRLFKIVGEPMSLAFTATQGGDPKQSLMDRKMDPEIISKAVRTLAEKLDEDQVLDLIETLTATKALCDGKKIVFDLHYEGKLPHLFKVLVAALEVQYGNFFDAFTDLAASKAALVSTQDQPT